MYKIVYYNIIFLFFSRKIDSLFKVDIIHFVSYVFFKSLILSFTRQIQLRILDFTYNVIFMYIIYL